MKADQLSQKYQPETSLNEAAALNSKLLLDLGLTQLQSQNL